MSARRIAAVCTMSALVSTGVLGGSPAEAASSLPTSTIASQPLQTCVDVSTASVSGFYGYVYGAACTGSSAQTLQFHAVTSGPPATFQITNVSSHQCLVQYQSGVKQHSCTGSVPPDPTDTQWTLQKVGTTGFAYRFAVTSTAGTPTPTCLQVNPKPRSHPGPVLQLLTCDNAQPNQVLTLTTAP